VRGEELVDVLGTGVADSLEEALRRLHLGLDDGEAAVLLGRDLEDRGTDPGKALLVSLREQTGVEHDLLGADDIARPVMDFDRADVGLIGLHGKASLSGGGWNE